jgi:plastocyanin
MPAQDYYRAPSFLDRLDGSTKSNPIYLSQTKQLGYALNFTTPGTGLESFLDLEKLLALNVTVNSSLSQIDYLYWNNTPAFCWPEGMRHGDFKIDYAHAKKYNVQGLSCAIMISGGTGANYTPRTLYIPVNTTVYWVNRDSISHEIMGTTPAYPLWSGNKTVPPGGSIEWYFNATGVYRYKCASVGHTSVGLWQVSVA